MSKKLYIGNLSYRATEEDLRKKFEEIGECISVKIIIDKFSGRSKGFAFVEMATEEAAFDAIKKLNGTSMYGRGIIVNEARPQKERGSGYRGRGRY
jgi:RNA recognition motif-containing protein